MPTSLRLKTLISTTTATERGSSQNRSWWCPTVYLYRIIINNCLQLNINYPPGYGEEVNVTQYSSRKRSGECRSRERHPVTLLKQGGERTSITTFSSNQFVSSQISSAFAVLSLHQLRSSSTAPALCQFQFLCKVSTIPPPPGNEK